MGGVEHPEFVYYHGRHTHSSRFTPRLTSALWSGGIPLALQGTIMSFFC